MGAGATWTPVARLLEAELDVVMPDARGHGRSCTPGAGYRYSGLAGDVIGMIVDLPVDAPLLVGHSFEFTNRGGRHERADHPHH